MDPSQQKPKKTGDYITHPSQKPKPKAPKPPSKTPINANTRKSRTRTNLSPTGYPRNPKTKKPASQRGTRKR
jgi:hypothetical protein